MWTSVEIAGKPADVFDPAGVDRPRCAVLLLHDLDGRTLRDAPAFSAQLTRLKLACVCPHGGACWWADRLGPTFAPAVTPERFLLDSVVPVYGQRWGLAARSVGLLGIGMGGQGAMRVAFKYPRTFSAVAAIGPAFDCQEAYGRGTPLDDLYDSKEQCRQDTAILHIHPAHFPPHIFFCTDPDDRDWYRGADRMHEKLAALGVAHEYDLTTRAGGHTWDYFSHMAGRAVEFLAAGLEQESRRLL
jgi:S-formylglutathione hydrolase